MSILVVSHDAGGAEILSCWIKHLKIKEKIIYCLKGPAISIFKKNIGSFENLNEKDIKKIKIKKIITGTSWDSDIEKKIILYGKKNKIFTCSFLDHWNNYLERFTLKKKKIFPDKIIVSDHYAFGIAKKKFKNVPIQLIKNYYKLEVLKKIKLKKNKIIKKILYVAEPIREHAIKQHNNPMYWGYDEFSSLTFFFNFMYVFGNKPLIIIFRNHPSEKIGKYRDSLKKHNKKHKIIFSKNINLHDDINEADAVVGGQSMAMVMSLYAGKKVYSTLPKNSQKLLPHKKIIYLER